MTVRHAMLRCTRGATAAEFAMVLPLLMLLLFGIMDAGRWLWTVNKAEKATQVGARMAIVTNVLAPGLIAEDYAGQNYGPGGAALKSGDLIPAEALGVVRCNSDGRACETAPCPDPIGDPDATTFAAIVERMQLMYPDIVPANVEVRYSGSGLGSAGALPATGPGGGPAPAEAIEISPLITVSLRNMTFKPMTTFLMTDFAMPDFKTTMTAEDVSGIYSS